MDIKITTFVNPFSFYFKLKEFDEENIIDNNIEVSSCNIQKTDIFKVDHGQYVAVMLKNIWARGVVSLEDQLLIWMVDYGFYIKPNDRTLCVQLPAKYKTLPTKVYEASVHGIIPLDKVINRNCEIVNEDSKKWNSGSIEAAQALIAKADRTYFVPVAILVTHYNEIVIGDLYLKVPGKGILNLVEELEQWPIFLQINDEIYLKNISTFYTSRKKHRACNSKPKLPDVHLPIIKADSLLSDYRDICVNTSVLPPFNEVLKYDNRSSTVVDNEEIQNKKKKLKLTPAEIEKYSVMFINVCGIEFNVLNVLLNKIKDLNICERYKNHDMKSVGRGMTPKLLKTVLN